MRCNVEWKIGDPPTQPSFPKFKLILQNYYNLIVLEFVLELELDQ